ncbi:hypothetical protein E2C01_092075 [Portunus trituberculatus]|uniref:Uncharacterized protein n=1 Tax=Portunus trituberculatus TaxID=210409 RepID=A0A5B7JUI8_PORTR|nr:hypothetical protein [Portunus trituberculatus]
MERVAEEMV